MFTGFSRKCAPRRRPREVRSVRPGSSPAPSVALRGSSPGRSGGARPALPTAGYGRRPPTRTRLRPRRRRACTGRRGGSTAPGRARACLRDEARGAPLDFLRVLHPEWPHQAVLAAHRPRRRHGEREAAPPGVGAEHEFPPELPRRRLRVIVRVLTKADLDAGVRNSSARFSGFRPGCLNYSQHRFAMDDGLVLATPRVSRARFWVYGTAVTEHAERAAPLRHEGR